MIDYVSPKFIGGAISTATGAIVYADFLSGYAGNEWFTLPRWDQFINYPDIDLIGWSVVCGLLVLIGLWLMLG